ncbi:murein hydrolase activator EnvC [Deinococcus sp. Leaf326]|uniref:murein hydrolase activator EnvC family protein n=1 Tax=Deinococcus sp. Leaf326 TaxID=1736338 RepID=UPI000AB56018|nr:M23 family metallopeptidase [Deinococcus sp. Leaf326]
MTRRGGRGRGPAVATLLLAAALATTQSVGNGRAAAQNAVSAASPVPSTRPPVKLPTTSERLEQLRRDLSQQRSLGRDQVQRLNVIRGRLQGLTAQQRQTLGRLDALADSVAELENDLARVTARVALAERQLDDLGAQRELTQARVASLQADVRSLLNALYRERSGQYLALLSQAKNLSDLLIRLDYANMSGRRNVDVIGALHREADVLAQQQVLQEQQTARLKTLQGERQVTLVGLRTRRAEQNRLLASLKASEQGQRALRVRTQAQQALTAQSIDQLVGQVVKERARIEAERRRLIEEERQRREAEARRIREAQERARQEALRLARERAEQERRAREAQAARERAAAQAAAQAQRERQQALAREQATLRARSAQVAQAQQRAEVQLAPLPAAAPSSPVGFPLPGGQVAAPFGASGAQWVILSGPSGAQATAALEGNVLAATYYASLGWVVLLDNGSGIVTGYFGLQNAGVNVGDRVARGAPLGVIGGSHIFGLDRMAFQLRQGTQAVAPGF